MSGDWSPDLNGQRNHSIPSPSLEGMASTERRRSRGQVLGNMMRDDISNSPRQQPRQTYRGSSPEIHPYPDMSMNTSLGGPVLQTSYEINHARQATRSPNISTSSTSRIDELTRENAELREELEHIKLDQEATQAACDDMLTKVMEYEDELGAAKTLLAQRDKDLTSTREELARISAQLQNHIPEILRPGPSSPTSPSSSDRSEERELRELRLRCNRLANEVKQKDEQLRSQSLSTVTATSTSPPPMSPSPSRELTALKTQAQTYQSQAETYLSQIHEWKSAYDALEANNSTLQSNNANLQRHNTELSQSLRDANATRTRANDRALEQAHAELDEARRVSAFFKGNSEAVAKKAKEVGEEVRGLRDRVGGMQREVSEQKRVIEALQLQVR